MDTQNLFEQAVRIKARWAYKGSLSVEDLWDLAVGELDTIFQSHNAQLKLSQQESLLQKPNREDEILSLKVEIVRHIVGVKLEEQEARLQAAENRAKRRRILDVLAQKQDEGLLSKTETELQEMLEAL